MKVLKKWLHQHKLLKRVLFSIAIVVVFLTGRYIPIPQVALTPYLNQPMLLKFASRLTGGDVASVGLFSLGLSPWMSAMILERLFTLGKRQNLSPKKAMTRKGFLMLGIALIQGLSLAITFSYEQTLRSPLIILETTIVLVAGAFIVAYLAAQNTLYGIGGSILLVLVNIVVGQFQNIPSFIGLYRSSAFRPYVIGVFIWAIFSLFWMLLLERAEYRIPLKRIAIHNKYDPINYLPIKLNSSGGMALMYVFTILGLVQYLFIFGEWLLPDVIDWKVFVEMLSQTNPVGLCFYIVVVYGLTLGFSLVNVDITLISKQLRHTGDFIPGVRPGRPTRNYLYKLVMQLSLVTSLILTILVVAPWLLLLISPKMQPLVMLTGVMMMTASMFLNIREEVQVLRLKKQYQGLFDGLRK